MEESKALEVMEEANRIIEDFSLNKFVVFTILFLIEIAACFWIGLKLWIFRGWIGTAHTARLGAFRQGLPASRLTGCGVHPITVGRRDGVHAGSTR